MKENRFSFLFLILLAMSTGSLLGCSGGFTPAGGGSSTQPSTSPGPDPHFDYAWHLKNTGQSVFATNGGVAGMDLNLDNTWMDDIFGAGLHVRISDDGVSDEHPDLNANFLTGVSRDFTRSSPYVSTNARPKASDDIHGTAVAGLIAGIYNNSIGAVGVAPLAQFSSANFLSSHVTQNELLLVAQADGNFDISNMSWGTSQNTFYPIEPTYETILQNRVTNGRSGRGSIFVKASGNDYFVTCRGSTSEPCVGNANMDPDAANPFTIVVGGLDAKGVATTYSSTGSNLWISAFGGEDGVSDPGIFTTDRPSCSVGYAKTSNSTTITFERGQNGNSGCRYTSAFGGTSAAAPQISGVVALMLEANPNLSWRDVKYILAKTARKVDPDRDNPITVHPLNSFNGRTIPSGYVYELAWITNTAGFHFHNWYGFGLVNTDAAVTMAQSYSVNLGTYQNHSISSSIGSALAIPDNSSTGASHTLNVSQNLKIESVRVSAQINHNDISDLAIELTAPSGTKSILMNINNSLEGVSGYTTSNYLLSNAFYQESSAGNWTLRVVDGDTGVTGQLINWTLHLSGGPN